MTGTSLSAFDPIQLTILEKNWPPILSKVYLLIPLLYLAQSWGEVRNWWTDDAMYKLYKIPVLSTYAFANEWEFL